MTEELMNITNRLVMDTAAMAASCSRGVTKLMTVWLSRMLDTLAMP